MSLARLDLSRKGLFHVRPALVLVCIGLLVAIFIPDAIAGKYVPQVVILALASVIMGWGWFSLVRDSRENAKWRVLLSMLGATYLTATILATFFELSPWKWLMHSSVSMYVRPWVHWGYSLMFFGIVGSLCARGQARIALLVVGVALLVLRASTGTWIF
jgi:hypothetical protein